MKFSLPNEYYKLLADHVSHHVIVWYDIDRGCWMTEDGFEIYDISQIVPLWAMNLARLHFGVGKDNYFCFTPNSWTLIEMYWPDEEREENWYS